MNRLVTFLLFLSAFSFCLPVSSAAVKNPVCFAKAHLNSEGSAGEGAGCPGVGRLSSAITTHYVKVNGVGDGTSWTNASGDLQMIINNAQSGDQIWVAEGVYKPLRPITDLSSTQPNQRENAFVLKEGVKLFGGFPGNNDGATLADRDPVLTPSVLSGDLGEAGNAVDNAYHVVISLGNSAPAELNGFTITGGNANNSSVNHTIGATIIYHYMGGGLLIRGALTLTGCTVTGNATNNYGGGAYCATLGVVTVSDTRFVNNTAASGGGWYNWTGAPRLSAVDFSNNTATGSGFSYYSSFPDPTQGGGGWANGGGNPELNDITFEGNAAFAGAGFANFSGNPRLSDVEFNNNRAAGQYSGYGGGWFNSTGAPELTRVRFYKNVAASGTGYGGGFCLTGGTPRLTAVIFEENSASNGGGLYNASGYNFNGDRKSSVPVILNSLFIRNNASSGGAIHINSGTPAITNSTISGNTASTNASVAAAAPYNFKIFNSIIWPESGYDGLFSRTNFSYTILGKTLITSSGFTNIGNATVLDSKTYQLVAGSPAIDAGLNSNYIDAGGDIEGEDLAGNLRVADGASNARLAAGMIDLGAYEYTSGPLPVTLTSLRATNVEDAISVTWQTSSETHASHFEVERSMDARNFSQVGVVNATGEASVLHSYEFRDFHLVGGQVYYRLKIIDLDGTGQYSRLVSIEKNLSVDFTIYPNPVISSSGSVRVMLQAPVADNAILEMYNNAGQKVWARSVPRSAREIDLPSAAIPAGAYLMVVRRSDGSRSVTQVVVR